MRFSPRARGLCSSNRNRRRARPSGRVAAAVRPVVEALESRAMMSATPLGVSEVLAAYGLQLRVVGTAGDDRIAVARTADGLLVSDGNTGWSATYAGRYASLL